MPDDDEFDSIKRLASTMLPIQSSPMKKMKCELVVSVKTLTSKLVATAPSYVDDILKMHKLIEHVKARIEALRAKGDSTAMLKVRLSILSSSRSFRTRSVQSTEGKAPANRTT
ncbi:hypothetical protein PHYPSEUDO_012135 [Phytophthora pseudosyringae]|uniref:Uncharacterized protein n=1 Tax=Phytophthora pseudosyringae TaxID=221518 RepID=A0A8T1V7Y5_9STRA|nr:hypothetical protein PHYPSEUDO_012135 [Phytophthora pseudosyringae]